MKRAFCSALDFVHIVPTEIMCSARGMGLFLAKAALVQKAIAFLLQ